MLHGLQKVSWDCQMLFRYEQFDQHTFQEINLKKLTQVFMDLMNQLSGEADRALRTMKQIWDRHDLEKATGMSFEEFRDHLIEQGLLQENGRPGEGEAGARFSPTAKLDREIQRSAFEEIFSDLKKDAAGNHPVNREGFGGEKLPETRAYEFGDAIQDVNFVSSIGNALANSGFEEFTMREDDLETHQREHLTSCATVILIDISHSMVLYGEDRITPAKKVAMALVEYIQQKYPKDTIDVVLFGDEAIPVDVDKIARVKVGEFHTNTRAGLQAALKILQKRKQVNKQVFMITDGKPSAIHENGRIYKNPFGLDPKIVAQTVNEAIHLRRKGITITTFMITTDPYLQDFVDTMTRANKGRAYYASLDNLGKFIFADYAKNKKKRV
ncbi:MAG TPA: VWA domain-containing protein [Candidatus Sumerlaeota bacterium]|nr:VWA domain-containing protein [Candidatus Sumerlaeota bacterium]